MYEKLRSGMYIIVYHTPYDTEYKIKEIGHSLLTLLQMEEIDLIGRKFLSIFSAQDVESISDVIELHPYKAFEDIVNSFNNVSLKCYENRNVNTLKMLPFKIKAYPIFSESSLEVTTLVFFRNLSDIEELWEFRRRLQILNFECSDEHFSVIPKQYFIDAVKSVYLFAQKHQKIFLLIGVEVIGQGYLPSKIKSAIQVIRGNIREYDEIGMLSESRVGIIIIGCAEGASKSILIRLTIALEGKGIMCTLYESLITGNTTISLISEKFPEMLWKI